MIKVTIMKKKIRKLGWENLKTWVGIFQVEIFWVGIFQGENSPGGSLIGGNFPDGSFHDTEENIYEEFSSVHALTLIFIRNIFILQTRFRPPPIITFSYVVEIFPHPLVKLIGLVSALIGNIEM